MRHITIPRHLPPVSVFSSPTSLLFVYVTCETIRANFAYDVFRSYPSVQPPIVALASECAKLALTLGFLIRPLYRESSAIQDAWASFHLRDFEWKTCLLYAVPAALFLFNNLIYMTVLPLTSPALLQVCILAKLPLTGILHHFMIKRQQNIFAWLSLLAICLGLVVFNISGRGNNTAKTTAWFLAPVAGLVIAVMSALAAIYSERLIKKGDFWVSQAYLYAWGVLLAAILIPGYSKIHKTPARPEDVSKSSVIIMTTILVTITACTGIVVAVILRLRTNILKVVGTTISLLTISISQFMLFPTLRSANFTPWKVCGTGIVATSVWCYNSWSQEAWPPQREGGSIYTPLVDRGISLELTSDSARRTLSPRTSIPRSSSPRNLSPDSNHQAMEKPERFQDLPSSSASSSSSHASSSKDNGELPMTTVPLPRSRSPSESRKSSAEESQGHSRHSRSWEDRDEYLPDGGKASWFRPDATNVISCAIIVLFATIDTAVYQY